MKACPKFTRPLFALGALAFGLGVWPTIYSPLGEDTAGNPMRENRFTGAEEVQPLSTGEWIDADEYREITAKAAEALKKKGGADLIATLEAGQTSFR